MTPFTKRVIQVIQQIPEGKVMSYGQVARQVGSPRGARQVVRILHTMSKKYTLPWHRIVNRKGGVTIQDEEGKFTQIALLKKEGIQFDSSNRIPLKEYGYIPEEKKSNN